MPARHRHRQHPYRGSNRPLGSDDDSRIDLEQWAVHGVLVVVGAIGVVVGFAFGRPIELAIGGLVVFGVIWASRTPPA